jgi:hypothetical protein
VPRAQLAVTLESLPEGGLGGRVVAGQLLQQAELVERARLAGRSSASRAADRAVWYWLAARSQ